MMDFLIKHKLINPSQHGFLKARSCLINLLFCTKHNGRQLGSKVFICNKLDVSKHPCSTLQHVMLNAAAMYRPVQCPAVNTQYYMIYYYISL